MHNDLWGIDASLVAAATTGSPTPAVPLGWNLITPDNTPGVPPARVGYSLTTFGGGIVMYGGVSLLPTAPPGTLPDVCFTPSTAAQFCHFHTNIWALIPGDIQANLNSLTGANWLRLAEVGAYAGPVPLGRFDMIAGAMGDQLFMHGGTTAAGPSNELWAYNLVSQTWQIVAPSVPAPSAASDLGYGVGVLLSRHLYRYVQAIDANGYPMSGSGQLWRWTPSASGGAGPGPAPASTWPTAATGALVVGILLALVNTGLLIAIARNAGASLLPDAISSWACAMPSLGGGKGGSGGGRRAVPADGFYTSVAEGAQYEAPTA